MQNDNGPIKAKPLRDFIMQRKKII
uniref:Uncharacterized protein n=1 Tax=Rhizophora mucronata TaxID=61149 RepID=A0A2P2NG98_RHIMU